MKDRRKIAPSTRMLTFKQLQETKVVAIPLTMRCLEPHASRRTLPIDWQLPGAHSKKVLNPRG
jgi:hypothetical protein